MRALAKEKPLEFATALCMMVLAVLFVRDDALRQQQQQRDAAFRQEQQQRDAAFRQEQQQNFEKLSRDIAALAERSLAGNERILRFSTVSSSALSNVR
jgi:hypothetical protein